jgi:DNA-binding transcriptional regulator YdaS (Cro superfamily)
MTLDEYFSRPGALTLAEMARQLGIKDPSQVRAWRYGYNGRQPGPKHSVRIEEITDGLVRRWDLRSDWHLVWPELVTEYGQRRAAA